MEVAALCVRLLMTALLLLVAQADFSYSQKVDAAFPQVVPNRQQHFEHEPVVISCEGLEGLTGWRVMKKTKGDVKTCSPQWATSTGPCEIEAAIRGIDSGEYWCELGTKKSNTVNIAVTARSVVLESPVLPVMEGDAVSLRCREKQMSSNHTAEFFKDGFLMESSSTGNMTIDSVSTSHEGSYKCRISGSESAESWLTVRAAHEDPHVSSQPPPHHTPQLYLPLWIGLGVSLGVLLLSVGLLRCWRHQTATVQTGTTTAPSSAQSSSSPQTEATYAVVTKPRKEKDEDESSHIAVYHTISLGNV
ncbi:low affinity immunoglobulin gamma Fc region receptor III-B-like [Symphorus nematophorus]